MSIYDVDYEQTSREIFPTHKRKTKLLALANSITKPLVELNLFWKFFRDGGSFTAYDALTTYTFGQYVSYQRRVYIRNEVIDGYAAGVYPLNKKYWTNILKSSISANERAKFGPSKIVYEYALNKIFETTFRQPPLLSDIYITNLNVTDNAFYVGQLDTATAFVSQTDQSALFFVTQNDPVPNEADYAIHIPVSVWTALAATNVERDAIVSSVANKYRLVGYNFQIITY
jgi:hypothetical protein